MNTIAINFEMLFDLHKSKIPKELLYKLIECNIKSGDKETISILKLTLIQKWLRDSKQIFISIKIANYQPDKPKYYPTIQSLSSKNMGENLVHGFLKMDTYEESLLIGISEALKLI